MNTEQLLQYHSDICEKARQVMAKKNHDYSGASGETPFANFEVTEKVGISKAEEGILIRILDKMMRINTFLKSGELKVSESVEDACQDSINYFILLAAMMKSKQKGLDFSYISPKEEAMLRDQFDIDSKQ